MNRLRALPWIAASALYLGAPAVAQVNEPALSQTTTDSIIAAEDAATHRLRATAIGGDVAAMEQLGLVYAGHPIEEEDEGNEANDLYLKEGVRWFKAAAEKGYPRAMFSLGVSYEEGRGVKRDPVQAIHWLRLAADQDQSAAMFNLGYIYGSGVGVERNEREAVRWFTMAADHGDVEAMYELGQRYHDGLGVGRDLTLSARWMRRAADNGNPGAMLSLSQEYAAGEGVTKDPAEAARWMRLAAENGNYEAAALLHKQAGK
jgi:uncharacterized protein